jgi:hypothetical protein
VRLLDYGVGAPKPARAPAVNEANGRTAQTTTA